jgi:hypothetical protein
MTQEPLFSSAFRPTLGYSTESNATRPISRAKSASVGKSPYTSARRLRISAKGVKLVVSSVCSGGSPTVATRRAATALNQSGGEPREVVAWAAAAARTANAAEQSVAQGSGGEEDSSEGCGGAAGPCGEIEERVALGDPATCHIQREGGQRGGPVERSRSAWPSGTLPRVT